MRSRFYFTVGFNLLMALFLMPLKNIAQPPSIKTSVSRTSILIGEQFTYTITAKFPEDSYTLTLPRFEDSSAHFEVIERKKVDSVADNGMLTCTQSIVLTSFDSGSHALPALLVNFDPYIDDTTFNMFTDSIRIQVNFTAADSLHDIKPIIEVTDEIPWWMWAIGGVLVILLAVIIYRIVKFYRRPKAVSSKEPLLSPYDEAIRALNELKQENLLEKNEVKQFHSRLAMIFRKFASRRQHDNLMGKTTGELLVKLESGSLEQSGFSLLANALRMGDAVKFAKYIPPHDESEYAFRVIRETIEKMNPSTQPV